MKKSIKNERGLSPVIASVLMILLVLVLATMIFLWARGFVSEHVEKFGISIEESCSSINFEASVYEDEEVEIINRGNVDIDSSQISDESDLLLHILDQNKRVPFYQLH